MSKITFRADDGLVERLEEFDDSKSEVMRAALREYLGEASDERPASRSSPDVEALDGLVAERVDAVVAERFDGAAGSSRPRDVNVNITVDGDSVESSRADADASRASADGVSHGGDGRKTDANAAEEGSQSCSQCGENVTPGHVYCPNCGEKASHRVFCDCGDELRSDWAFCPSCGRRTPAADVLDQP